MKAKHIAIIVLAVLFLIILVQNTQVIAFHLFFWKIAMPQIIFIPMVMFLGFLLGFIAATITHRKKRTSASQMKVQE